MTATCETCEWWRHRGAPLAAHPNAVDADEGVGTCHLWAPTVIQIQPGWVDTVWPQTRADDFCGDWSDQGPGDPDDGEREARPDEGEISNVVAIGRAA